MDFKITGFRLASPTQPAEWLSIGYFDLILPDAGIEIVRCRLMRNEKGEVFIRGPAFDLKRNRTGYGQGDFKRTLRRGVMTAVIAIYEAMSGKPDHQPTADAPNQLHDHAGVVRFLDVRRAANG